MWRKKKICDKIFFNFNEVGTAFTHKVWESPKKTCNTYENPTLHKHKFTCRKSRS